MTPDERDLARWMSDWRAVNVGNVYDAEEMRRRAERSARGMRVVAVLEGIFGAAVLLVLTWRIVTADVAGQVAWLVALWSYALLVAAYAAWNRRGGWTAVGATIAEYRTALLLRARRRRQVAGVVMSACVATTATVVGALIAGWPGWLYRYLTALPPVAWLAAAVLVAAHFVGGALVRTRTSREIALLGQADEP